MIDGLAMDPHVGDGVGDGDGDRTSDRVDGVILHVDAETLRPTYANAAVQNLVGEPPEQWWARAESWSGLFDPEDWPRVVDLCRAVVGDGKRRRLEHLLLVRGRPRWFRTSFERVATDSAATLLVQMEDVSGEMSNNGAALQAWTREILRQAPLGMFVLDRKGVVKLAEGKGLAGLNIDPADMLGKSMIDGEWACRWIVSNARRALAGDRFSEVVSVPGGWLSLKYVPVTGRRGRVQGVIGFATDITECKRAADMLDTLDAVLWHAHGKALVLAFASGACEKLFGQSSDDWLDRPGFFESQLYPTERRTVMAAVNELINEGGERILVHRIVRPDGLVRWCRTAIRALPSTRHGRRDVLGITLDITERKAAEQAFASRDRRWQLLAEQAPIIAYTVDRELRFTSGVGAGLRALGLRGDGILAGASLEQYFHGADEFRPFIEAHRRALAGETVRTSGSWLEREHEVALEPLRDEAGSIIGVVGVAVDVTERRQNERQQQRLLDAERAAHAAAEEAVRIRDQFLSVASHELRTPLTSLLLVLQALSKKFPDDDDSHSTAHKVQIAQRQAQRLEALISRLLDASRLSAGHRFTLESETMNLTSLVGEIVERFELELEKTHTTLHLEADGGAMVGYWDKLRIDQMVTNLLSNAIKYGRGRPVEISLAALPDERVRLRIVDHGIGIAAGDLPIIFRPFQRLHDNHHYGGLGLGLYIVAETVRAHGGEIQVTSEPGQGTAFNVELPKRIPAQ